jgi:hypothetical protein
MSLETKAKLTVSKEKRKVEFSWTNEAMTRRVKLSVYHSPERKHFWACVSRSDLRMSGNFSVEEYEPFRDIMQLGKESVDRFSFGKLQNYAGQVLMDFLDSDNEWKTEAEALVS